MNQLMTAPTSRRRILRHLGQGVAVVLLVHPVPTLPAPTVAAPGDTDDGLLARLLAMSPPRIPRRGVPYRATRPLRIPGDTTVTIERGTRFLYSPTALAGTPVGFFEAMGDNVAILVDDGGTAVVECVPASPFVYAAMMCGHSGFAVVGLSARDCQHVRVTATTEVFGRVRTQGEGANVARNVSIRGGGASYAVPQKQGDGACLLRYVIGCDVRDTSYVNVPHGLEWWGGDANPAPSADGQAHSERKCRDLHVERVIVRTAAGGGIWGSMGQNVTVVDCRVEDIGDVGFDAEGSNAVTFERCVAHNARNGCFSTFFLCGGVRFVDCHGVVDDKAFPLMRVYNSTLSALENKRVEIVGGTFECSDASGAGTIDSAMGPVREFIITGATLTNVRVDLAFFNMHMMRVAGNLLVFPYPLPAVAAIRAGSAKTVPSIPGTGIVPGSVVIENNRIRYTAKGPANAIAISLREDDFNGSAVDRISGNVVSGAFGTGIAVANASANIGVLPDFTITANRFSGLATSARLLTVTQEGTKAGAPVVKWDGSQTRDGRRVGLAAALGGGRG